MSWEIFFFLGFWEFWKIISFRGHPHCIRNRRLIVICDLKANEDSTAHTHTHTHTWNKGACQCEAAVSCPFCLPTRMAIHHVTPLGGYELKKRGPRMRTFSSHCFSLDMPVTKWTCHRKSNLHGMLQRLMKLHPGKLDAGCQWMNSSTRSAQPVPVCSAFKTRPVWGGRSRNPSDFQQLVLCLREFVVVLLAWHESTSIHCFILKAHKMWMRNDYVTSQSTAPSFLTVFIFTNPECFIHGNAITKAHRMKRHSCKIRCRLASIQQHCVASPFKIDFLLVTRLTRFHFVPT